MKHGLTTDTTEFHKPSVILLLSLLNLLILRGQSMAMKHQSVPDNDMLQLFWGRLMITFKQCVLCLRFSVAAVLICYFVGCHPG